MQDAAPDQQHQPDGQPAAHELSEPEALAAFAAAWDETVFPHIETSRPAVASHWANALAREEPARSARRGPCREGAALFRDMVLPGEAVLFGSVEALDRDDACWRVDLFAGMEDELVAYLLAASGELLVVAWPPEG